MKNTINLTITCKNEGEKIQVEKNLNNFLSQNKNHIDSYTIAEGDNNTCQPTDISKENIDFDFTRKIIHDKNNAITYIYEYVVQNNNFVNNGTSLVGSSMAMNDVAGIGIELFEKLDVVEILTYELDSANYIKEIVDKYKDNNNVAIISTSYVSTEEYSTKEYYLSYPVPGLKELPLEEALEKRSKILESLGFININSFFGYEYKIAYIYPNEVGKKILERINFLNESETEEEVQK